jgi:hypothetical protein
MTTAWIHDSRDGGGRAASGTAAEEVEQRMEQLPRVRGEDARNSRIPHPIPLPEGEGDLVR